MALYTDIAAEIYPEGRGRVPAGVRVHTASASGIDLVRVDVLRDGLARKKGRYITLDMPSFARIDERNEAYVWAVASQLRTLLPREGLVLVAGIGNRGVTADALGPRTVQHVLVTMGASHPLPLRGIRPVAAVAPGVSQSAGLSLQELARALVGAVRPTALLCVDSLCSSEPQRLGRTIQFSDTGLAPADPGSSRHLDAAGLGVPVVAAGVPTLMEAAEGRDLVVAPRALDSVIAHGAALLGAAINRALQPRLTVNQLCWLASQA